MKISKIMTVSLGNTLEWFDFGLFIFMAPMIGNNFFPHQNPKIATLEALTVFAAGFVCRPLGGILLGHFGDTRGRAATLRFSVLLITLSTLLIGVMPGYASIGVWAPILFTLLRLIQGISVGGEYSGVIIYLAESAPENKRGFITSFAATGANIGFLFATISLMLLNTFFTKQIIADWAWRLPFILVGIPGSFIFYYRFKLSETSIYRVIKSHHHIEAFPFLAVMKYARLPLLKILGLCCMGGTFYYVFFGYMPTYLQHYIGIPLQTALCMQSILLVAMLFLVPVAGLCGDFFTRKKMLILTVVATILFILPGFYLFQTHSLVLIMLSLSIATVLSSLDQGNSLTAVVENCPLNVRYSGVAFIYNLGVALFGGTAPLVITLLIDKVGPLAPAYYLILMALITLVAASMLLAQNRSAGLLNTTRMFI